MFYFILPCKLQVASISTKPCILVSSEIIETMSNKNCIFKMSHKFVKKSRFQTKITLKNGFNFNVQKY